MALRAHGLIEEDDSLSSEILVIISSGDADKALTGMMYAYNAMNNGWMDKVKVVFFGPAQKLLTEHPGMQQMARQIVDVTQAQDKDLAPTACKFISDRDKTSNAIASLGVHVEYVGLIISEFIKQGFTPLVF